MHKDCGNSTFKLRKKKIHRQMTAIPAKCKKHNSRNGITRSFNRVFRTMKMVNKEKGGIHYRFRVPLQLNVIKFVDKFPSRLLELKFWKKKIKFHIFHNSDFKNTFLKPLNLKKNQNFDFERKLSETAGFDLILPWNVVWMLQPVVP